MASVGSHLLVTTNSVNILRCSSRSIDKCCRLIDRKIRDLIERARISFVLGVEIRGGWCSVGCARTCVWLALAYVCGSGRVGWKSGL